MGIINLVNTPISGHLRGFSETGSELWSTPVELSAHGRLEMDVSNATGDSASQIKTMRLDIDPGGQAVGYQKFYQSGKYRVGLEASPRANQARLFVPHIASTEEWWTGIGLLNTTNTFKSLEFAFDTGQQATTSLEASSHGSFTIASLFNETRQPGIGAAQVADGSGVVGLMLFGGERVLSGVSLSDATARTLHFPHVAHDSQWWTGLVVYNPGDQIADLTLIYRNAQGDSIGNGGTASVLPGKKLVGTPDDLQFPAGTQWFTVQSSQPVTGFELFGTSDRSQLAGYSVVDLAAASGVFPKLERDGWTGLAFVNPGGVSIRVQVWARDDGGNEIAYNVVDLTPGQKWVDQAQALFPNQALNAATYISYAANGEVIGFQLNGSSDGTMLDAIPALGAAAHIGTSTLYFPHIAAE